MYFKALWVFYFFFTFTERSGNHGSASIVFACYFCSTKFLWLGVLVALETTVKAIQSMNTCHLQYWWQNVMETAVKRYFPVTELRNSVFDQMRKCV